MECDLCGKANANAIVSVEGVEMHACSSCRQYGTLVRTVSEQNKSVRSSRTARRGTTHNSSETQNNTIEQVRDDVGELLRKHRDRLGLTHEQFSQKLGIKASTYHHYESGHKKPTIEIAKRLERELKVPLVGHVKIGKFDMKKEEGKGMTLGDFIKKR